MNESERKEILRGGQMPAKLHELLKDVRADYVATIRDLHGRKGHILELDLSRLPLIVRLDEAIKDLGIISGKS